MPMADSEQLWELVGLVRSKSPLVQCLTNYVSMDLMANGLLALGASPAMVHATGELDACAEEATYKGAPCRRKIRRLF